jgi:hypothetical protein
MQQSAVTLSDLRWFGCIVAAVFAVLGTVVWWRLDASVAYALWGTGVVLATAYYAIPPLRMPLYLGWMALVTPVGKAVSYVILAVLYYAVITPTGFVVRPFRRDQLARRFDAEASSYWSEHDPSGEAARYFRQS